MTDPIDELRRIFREDQAGPPPRLTPRQSHDRVFAMLVQGLGEAEFARDRAAVRTYCHLIDRLKTEFPDLYPGWNRPSRYWKGNR
jgi:hypothetical protein